MELKKGLAALVMTMILGVGMLTGCGGGGNDKAASGAAETKKIYNVGIVQLVEHPALDAANKGFVDALTKRGYKEGENIKYDRHNAQADQSNLQNIAQRFVSSKLDLIYAIATPAAQTMANATKDIPIVGSAITDYKSAKLVKDDAKPGTNVTGTTDMNPIKEQIELLKKLVPGTKSMGIIYNSSEVNSQIQADVAKKVAADLGMTTEIVTISTVNDIQQAANSLVGKVQAMYIPTDNVMASAMPTLTSITNEKKIPVICGEANMVKGGALATLAVDYYELGKQSGEMAADILEGKSKPADMAIQAQKTYETFINKKNVDQLAIEIPADLQKYIK